MHIVFRVDASTAIGSGHLMRCLTLASALKTQGARCSFVCRVLPGHLNSIVEEQGFGLHQLRYGASSFSQERDAADTIDALHNYPDIGWLVVDSYFLDRSWERRIRARVKKIMVIDDLANRSHDCDVLLDQNLYHDMETRYVNLVPKTCRKFLGPKHALLRHEFIEARKKLKMRDGKIRRILIFMGGSDATNETAKALKAIRLIKRPDIAVDVVVGSSNPHKEEIAHMAAALPNTAFFCQVGNIAGMIADADLALGAGGATTWERCYLGLPTITIIVAENQAAVTEAVAAAGAIWNLGWHENVKVSDISETLASAVEKPEAMKQLSSNALGLMNGMSGERNEEILAALLKDDYASA